MDGKFQYYGRNRKNGVWNPIWIDADGDELSQADGRGLTPNTDYMEYFVATVRHIEMKSKKITPQSLIDMGKWAKKLTFLTKSRTITSSEE